MRFCKTLFPNEDGNAHAARTWGDIFDEFEAAYPSLLAVAKAATKGLYVMERCVPAVYHELVQGAAPISHRELDAARAELSAALAALPAATKIGE